MHLVAVAELPGDRIEAQADGLAEEVGELLHGRSRRLRQKDCRGEFRLVPVPILVRQGCGLGSRCHQRHGGRQGLELSCSARNGRFLLRRLGFRRRGGALALAAFATRPTCTTVVDCGRHPEPV